MLAFKISMTGLFIMAGLGCAFGVDPFTCAVRALIGCIVLYLIVSIAERIIIESMAAVLIAQRKNKPFKIATHTEEQSSESK